MMVFADDVSLAALIASYPAWDIWLVPVFIGPDRWCCKRAGAPVAAHNAASAGELAEWLGQQP